MLDPAKQEVEQTMGEALALSVPIDIEYLVIMCIVSFQRAIVNFAHG